MKISKKTLNSILANGKEDKKTVKAVAIVAMNQNIRKPKKGRLRVL